MDVREQRVYGCQEWEGFLAHLKPQGKIRTLNGKKKRKRKYLVVLYPHHAEDTIRLGIQCRVVKMSLSSLPKDIIGRV